MVLFGANLAGMVVPPEAQESVPPRLVRTAEAAGLGISARELAGPLWHPAWRGVHLRHDEDLADPAVRLLAVAAVLPDEPSICSGVSVVSPERAICQIARRDGAELGLAAADASCRAGVTTPALLREFVATQRGRPGVPAVRLVAGVVDPRAASIPESHNIREEGFEAGNLVVVRATSIDVWGRRAELVRRIKNAQMRGLARDRSRDTWDLRVALAHPSDDPQP